MDKLPESIHACPGGACIIHIILTASTRSYASIRYSFGSIGGVSSRGLGYNILRSRHIRDDHRHRRSNAAKTSRVFARSSTDHQHRSRRWALIRAMKRRHSCGCACCANATLSISSRPLCLTSGLPSKWKGIIQVLAAIASRQDSFADTDSTANCMKMIPGNVTLTYAWQCGVCLLIPDDALC